LPVFMFIKDNKEINRLTGEKNIEDLELIINNN